MKYLLLLFFTIYLIADDALVLKALEKGLTPIPKDFTTLKKQVDDTNNPMTSSKIALGKKLFFDKDLSKDRTISCATCHDIKNGGEDGIPTAIGYLKQENPNHLNTPTVLNTAYSKHFFWDGRVSTLREQAKGPMQAHFEMASTPGLIEKRVKEKSEYKKEFHIIFGENSITFDNIAKAIEVYEKTLVTRSRYDLFLEGDSQALSTREKRGLNLFIEMGCKGCHFGPAIGGQKMQKFPLRDYNSILNLTTTFDEQTKKRAIREMSINFDMYQPYPFKNKGDFMGKNGQKIFRVPILRNITKTQPYFHNGAVKDLREAIKIMSKHQVGIELSIEQLDALEEFLKSLEGELVVYDTNNTSHSKETKNSFLMLSR